MKKNRKPGRPARADGLDSRSAEARAKRGRRQISLTMSDETIAHIDEYAKALGCNRSRAIELRFIHCVCGTEALPQRYIANPIPKKETDP